MILKRKEFRCELDSSNKIDMIADVKNWVQEFVSQSNMISISEYTSCLNRIGDDSLLHIIIYYWDKE